MAKRSRLVGFALAIYALGGCGSPQPPAMAVAPFVTLEDAQARHELFRNVQFEDVTKTMPDGSVDHIDIDGGLSAFVLARVTAQSPGPGSKFETVFRGDKGTTLTKIWAPAAGSTKATATGLFVLPAGISSAGTRLATETRGN